MNRENEAIFGRPFVPLSPEELNAVIDDQIAVTEIIGVGGSGAVYRAQQTRLGRTVAVKVLSRRERTEYWDFSERFMLEAKAMARLDHPNIVKVHDIGETKTGLPYLVMEHVDGIDLASLIAGGQLTWEHLASWVPQACEALEYAHNHEMVHRDIKPGNLLVDHEGRVKITDFGLVKMKSHPDRNRLTQAEVSMGSPAYLAPEAMETGAQVDHRADVFSMGVVLYEMLTGRVPRGAWTPPSSLREGVSSRFDEIVIRAMQPDPEGRYSRIADLGRDVLLAARELQAGPERRLLVPGGGRAKRMRLPVEGEAPLRYRKGLDV